MTLGELFAGIANAIRSKDGTTASIPATTFPERIMALSGGGVGGGGGDGSAYIVSPPPVNISTDVSVTAVTAIFEHQVVSVDGATYGFALNADGYYESQNKGVKNSYAMCKIVFNSNYQKTVSLKCINYAQKGYDYGLISNVDTMLSMDNSADETGVLKSFKSNNSTSVVSVSATIPAGEHFVCVKFIKNASTNSNNDTLQFKVS